MINLFLAFDDEDEDIGSFNQGCLEDCLDFFETTQLSSSLTYIKTRTLNSSNIELKLEGLSSCVFVAYSHGQHDKLTSKGDAYVSIENIMLFKNSFFYTVSCNSGLILGNQLVDNGCHSFFGYKSVFNSWAGYKDFSEVRIMVFSVFLMV